ncbi:hypothetical protein Fmac_030512 [Flemingia macrophylla]|uniref:Uncharacterized protein n=1 Tax=Flemingia macrophylla TaxID=520843 RepID=A0ABD1KZE8_9FABA
MASNREREESSLTFTIPSSSSHSSPITVSDQLDSYLADPRSASGSFQNDGLLSAAEAEPDFGFFRTDFRQNPLAGTVEFYQRHVFLCYKNPRVWPPRIEAAEFDRLPRLLYAAVVARKNHMKKEEIELHGLQGKVFVSPCSHIGGSQYAGNVIVFGPDMNRDVTGHWYGYVAPDDVPLLLQHHIVKGEILDSLWRGQMALSVDEQLRKQEQRLLLNGLRDLEESTQVCRSQDNLMSCQANRVSCCQSNEAVCCQSNGDSSFLQNHMLVEKRKDPDVIETQAKLSADNKSSETVISRLSSGKGTSRKCPSVTTWLDGWEQEDTYAALAVVCAVVSVAIAYNCYKQLR